MSDLSEDYDSIDVPDDLSADVVEPESAGENESEVGSGDEEEPIKDIDLEEPEFDIKTVSDNNKEITIVREEDRLTRNVLSVAEMTEIVSIRSVQIQDKNNCLCDISGLTDPRMMARRELMMRMCPLYLRRHVGEDSETSYYEIWDPNKMAFATIYTDV